ncbi:hypothetical protein F5B22DRAFT_594349 [Xylaria bambusicola]|uniref:uncharacterized protein n=1 Tax=Xylaria bambusicola TaxID=326684 RepID=UPI0020077DF8|nr:uncharacterized protein F5B22DRAFT_594349 [Xylaria bambusicola]KAI0521856.1 hypothetical protein F5B22DRAFT_594349 [Xylaria bambusicola]
MPASQIIADYLPDDLLAVPAHGEVGFIVAAAAAAGAHSWEPDKRSGYPAVLGERFQFEFRAHQTLGTVGAFVKFEHNDGSRRPLTLGQLRIALLQARADLEVSFLFTGWITWDRQFNAMNDSSNLFNKFFYMTPQASSHNCRSGLCVHSKLSKNNEDKYHLAWLFAVDTPTKPPAIFPSTLVLPNPHIFKLLAFHSSFWSSIETRHAYSWVGQTTAAPNLIPGAEEWHNPDDVSRVERDDLARILEFLDETNRENNEGFDSGFVDDGENNDNESSDNSEDSEPSRSLPFALNQTLFKDPKRVYVFGYVLELSVKFLYDKNSIKNIMSSLPKLTQQYVRIIVLLQINQIDKWLRPIDKVIVRCEMNSLYRTTLALLDTKEGIGRGVFDSVAPKGKENPFWEKKNRTGGDIFSDYFKTLKCLSRLLNEFGKLEEYDMDASAGKISLKGKTYRMMTTNDKAKCSQMTTRFRNHAPSLSFLTHVRSGRTGFGLMTEAADISLFLRALGKVEAICNRSRLSNEAYLQKASNHNFDDSSPHSQVLAEVENTPEADTTTSKAEGKESLPEKDTETEKLRDTIRDVLIWRCILMGILFSTAPDNSDMLSSGMWERIVPII